MSDSETLRAAARIMMQKGHVYLAGQCDSLAAETEARDAAQLQAAERDQRLGEVAQTTYYKAVEPRWEAVARAVREAIEAEQ